MGVQVYRDPYMVNPNVELHVQGLLSIIGSNTVISRSADALNTMGVSADPVSLIRTLRVEPVGQTEIISIKVTSPDREEAKYAADVIAGQFQRFYRELVSGATEQSREFIEKQLKDAKAKLEKAREARTAFKKTHELIELQLQTQAQVQRAAQIESDMVQTGIQAQDLNSKLQAIESQIDGKPEMILSSQTSIDNPIYKDLLAKKIAVESELGTMMATRGRNHPEVKELLKRKDAIQNQIKDQAEKIIGQEVTARDQLVVGSMQSRLTTNAEAAGAAARQQALAQALDEQKAKLQALPEEEMKMAQLDLDVTSAEETYRLLRARLDEARIKANETAKSNAIQVIDPASVQPVNKKMPLKLALAFMFSSILGAGIVFMLHYLDNSIRTPEEAEELLSLPVVSMIPLSRSHALAKRPDNEPLLASYEMLTALLWRTVGKTSSPVLLIASAEAETGRTTTAGNLAITLARDGARVILVDADMRRPSQHQIFGTGSKPGLANILSGAVGIEDALLPTKIEGLLLMPAGPVPDNPIRLLRSQQMVDFVQQISNLADFIVFDSPAGVTFADASLMASIIRNVLIVHAAGRPSNGAESEFRGRLELAGANVVGAILNMMRPEDSNGYSNYRQFYNGLTAQSTERYAALGGVKAIPSGDENTDS
jgi:capsular exopolysaccharide synthesis family protein